MRSAFLRTFLVLFCFTFFYCQLDAQYCFNTGLNRTVINLPCNQNCVNVPVRIPHLRSTTTYTVNSVPYAPYTWVTPGGAEDADIYDDDMWSDSITLPFSFCFY